MRRQTGSAAAIVAVVIVVVLMAIVGGGTLGYQHLTRNPLEKIGAPDARHAVIMEPGGTIRESKLMDPIFDLVNIERMDSPKVYEIKGRFRTVASSERAVYAVRPGGVWDGGELGYATILFLSEDPNKAPRQYNEWACQMSLDKPKYIAPKMCEDMTFAQRLAASGSLSQFSNRGGVVPGGKVSGRNAYAPYGDWRAVPVPQFEGETADVRVMSLPKQSRPYGYILLNELYLEEGQRIVGGELGTTTIRIKGKGKLNYDFEYTDPIALSCLRDEVPDWPIGELRLSQYEAAFPECKGKLL